MVLLLSLVHSQCRPPHIVIRRILIVDDNHAIRAAIRFCLESREGVEVCGESVDGRDAVAKAQALKPDLVILDMLMPGLNGIEVAAILKKSLPNTKTILFTMFGDYVGKHLAAAAGVNLILSKQQGIGALAQAVSALLIKPPHPNSSISS
jgi:two-component system, NarL family, vancomycin resistance associated response regulator VraR